MGGYRGVETEDNCIIELKINLKTFLKERSGELFEDKFIQLQREKSHHFKVIKTKWTTVMICIEKAIQVPTYFMQKRYINSYCYYINTYRRACRR